MDAKFLSLDPGETTGWATFDEAGKLTGMGQFTQSQQNKWLDENIVKGLKGVIVEDYRNYWSQKKWDRNRTSKNIGAVELICEMRSVPYFLQPANVKIIGYKWAGLDEAPANHAISHQYDAVAHGYYYLVKQGIRQPEVPDDD